MPWLDAWFYRQIALWAMIFKRPDVALEYWERIRVLRPRDANVLASIAHFKALLGNRAEAIELIRQTLDIDGSRAAQWFNLGFLQQEEESHQEAIANFRRAVSLDAKLDRAWYGLALSLIKVGRIEEAIVALEKNTELQPMSPYGWYQLAHAYCRLGQTPQAERVIRKLATFEPKVAVLLEKETGLKVAATHAVM